MTARKKTGGRQKGTPNRVTALARDRIQGADPVGFMIRVASGERIEDSGSGEMPTLDQRIHAAKWLGSKICADAKDSPVSFPLGELKDATDGMNALAAVIQRVAEGEMSPSEAKSVADVIGTFMRARELHEFEARLAALEARQQ